MLKTCFCHYCSVITTSGLSPISATKGCGDHKPTLFQPLCLSDTQAERRLRFRGGQGHQPRGCGEETDREARMVPPRLEPSKLSHPSRRGINAKLSPSSHIRAQTAIGLEGHGARPGGVGFLWRRSLCTKENENCSWTSLATPATLSHIFVLPSSPLQYGQAEDKEKHGEDLILE